MCSGLRDDRFEPNKLIPIATDLNEDSQIQNIETGGKCDDQNDLSFLVI